MIKLMVIAGKASNSLADFLGKRGTFEVSYVFNSLKENISDVQSKIIKVDKMLYLFNSEVPLEGTDIRTEMKLLSGLLKETAYFNVGEIVFVVKETEESEIAIKYFKTIVEAANYTNFSIKVINSALTYEIVYNSIMGITATQNFKNSYTKIYQDSRNSEAELSYAALDNYNTLITSYNGEKEKEYEQQKDLMVRSASREVLTGGLEKREPKEINLEPIELPKKVLKKKLITITGAGKTGKSIWAAILGVSGVQAKNRVLIIDSTANGDVKNYALATSITGKEATVQEVFEGETEVLTVCRVEASKFRDSFVHWVTQESSNFDVVIVVHELADLDVQEHLSKMITNSILMCSQREADLSTVEKIASKLKGNRVLILNNNFKTFGQEKLVDNNKVREYVPTEVRIVVGKYFDSLDVDDKYFNGVIK